VNFITCHDGFTLHDSFAYNHKHNEANGENNADGCDDNRSWHCGQEGQTDDPLVLELRQRQIRNALTLLMVSQGVPMILAGDEFAHTQQGNNNCYCHDSELAWLDWDRLEEHRDLFRFTRHVIALRKAHKLLRAKHFLDHAGAADCRQGPFLSWHGVRAWAPDFSGSSRSLAFMLCGEEDGRPEAIYVGMNMYWEPLGFAPPQLDGLAWHVAVDTAAAPPQDAWPAGQEPPLADPSHILIAPRSVVVLLGKC
jgi:glycogen operon protein